MTDVTEILNALDAGDPKAAEQLLPLVYDELRKLAAGHLANEKPGHTLDATALVHEAYLRLVGPTGSRDFANRRHFFAAAAEAMRRILVNHARDRKRLKRGGGRVRLELLDALKLEALRVKERDEANDELKHRLGVSAMLLANAAYDSRDYELAVRRLDKVPVQQRGWEWRYLKRQLHGGIFTLYGHTSGVTSAAFSPDGPRIVTRIVPGGVPNARARSGLKVWDMRTGAVLRDLTEPDPPSAGFMVGWRGERVAFSPDGTRIVIGGYRIREGRAKVVDVRTRTTLVELIGHGGAVHCVAFGGDGKRVVTGGSDMTVKVWDAEKGGPALLDLRGHTGEVNTVAFSPDGTRIISGSEDRTVRVWDARTGVPLAELKGHRGGVTSVSFSADGTRLLTVGGGEVFVWDAPIPPREVEMVGHTSPITATAFSADGTRIATASEDNTVKVWDARAGTKLAELKTDLALEVAFSSDGTRIVTKGHDKTTKVWDAHTGQELKGEAIPKTVRPGRTSPDHRFLAYLGPYPFFVKVVPLVPDEEEIAYRRLHARPNASRYRKLLELDPKNRDLHLTLGELLENSGRTDEAVACYLKASELEPKDTVLSLKVAALLAWFGRDRDFAATRQRILAFAKGTKDAGPANEGAKACSIRPSADKAELDAALALGRAAVKANSGGNWNLVALGMAEYRSGNYAAADAALLAAAKAAPGHAQATGIAGFYRAMSLFRQGKADETRKLAAETAAKMKPLPADEKNPLAGGAHYDDLIWWLAYREAKALIGFDAAHRPEAKPNQE
jgi:RNA polymerase sigma factor (TIGR02999 family)